MLLTWLQLRDFRCHRGARVRPGPGVNVLLGGNGAGKSSVLEAIGYLADSGFLPPGARGRAGRVGRRRPCSAGSSPARPGRCRVEVEIPGQGRHRVQVDGKRAVGPGRGGRPGRAGGLPARRPRPGQAGPGLPAGVRRRPGGAAVAGGGGRISRSTSAPCASATPCCGERAGGADPVTLEVWDERLAVLGAAVVRRRLQALGRWPAAWRRCAAVWGAGERRSPGSTWRRASVRWTPARRRGRCRRAWPRRWPRPATRTSTGAPPRWARTATRWRCWPTGATCATRASQGEQRTVALALRLAAFDLLAERRRSAPVLVLDDVFSELDERTPGPSGRPPPSGPGVHLHRSR